MIRASLLYFLILLPAIGLSQEFNLRQYRVMNGLPSDIIKGCSQDSIGYFWIATDDGLVKYDGVKFEMFRDAMHSNFAKGFLRTRSGRLFAFGDLDLIEIKNLGDTVIFRTIKTGERSLYAATLYYPKSIYEDIQGDIWISEPQSVVRLHGNQMKRYGFDLKNRSTQFLRSFSFFEDAHANFYTTSLQGNVFIYDRAADSFLEEELHLPGNVEHASVVGNDLLIGTSSGLYSSSLLSTGGFTTPQLRLGKIAVSVITPISDDLLFVGTRSTTHYLTNRSLTKFDPLPYSINNVNSAYVSREKDIWLSGNEGLILLKQNLFLKLAPVIPEFIEAIAEDVTKKSIYFAKSDALFEYQTGRYEMIAQPKNAYFQALLGTPEGLWAANSFELNLYRGKSVVQKFDFSNKSFFVSDLSRDAEGNVWASQQGNRFAFEVDNHMQLHQYLLPGNEGFVNLVRQGPDGVYIGSNGTQSYLFIKSRENSEFKNISKPLPFKPQGDFSIFDIAFLKGNIWLATSEGVVKFSSAGVERRTIAPEFAGLPVRAIKVYQENKLLLTNALGLVLYDPETGDYHLFNECAGLASNTIPQRGLFVASDGTIWVGTSKGLCYTPSSLTQLEKTASPHVVETRINGRSMRLHEGDIVPHGSYVSVVVSSVTFPEREVTYRYSLNGATEQSTKSNVLDFSNQPAGEFDLIVYAKKNGSFTWSNPLRIHFTIALPFWRETWFILMCIVITATLISITIIGVNIINKKRNKELELLVAERTEALQVTNEELSQRNNELDRFVYSASHDLSAPLKSILGLITVARMEKPSAEIDNYLELMRKSVLKLDSFIKDIISYSRNARLEIKKTQVDFSALVNSIWADLQFSPNVEKIRFEVINKLRSSLVTDETRLKIIFNNLLSNAIKFHRFDLTNGAFIRVQALEDDQAFIFMVEDNGMGIAPELTDRIFDMFYRATETVQGSGLGLYILKETLLKLGGSVHVTSTLGKGTTFTIRLPK